MILLEFIVKIANTRIAGQKVIINFPLENDRAAFIWAGYGIQHIAVAL